MNSLLQISCIPPLFTVQFIERIQSTVETRQQLLQLLRLYCPQSLSNRTLSIAKEEYYKALTKKSFVQELLTNFYRWMTEQQYSVQQKYETINVLIKLIYLISEIDMNKHKWKDLTQKEVTKLSKWNVNHLNDQINNNSGMPNTSSIAPIMTLEQNQHLLSYINSKVLPFYVMLQTLLYQEQPFTITAQFYEPVPSQSHSMSLNTGKKLQASQFLSIQALKQYISDKPPVQEKKDPKKK